MNAELLEKATNAVSSVDNTHWRTDNWPQEIAVGVLRVAIEVCAEIAKSEGDECAISAELPGNSREAVAVRSCNEIERRIRDLSNK